MREWISNMSAGFIGGLLASLVVVGLLAWQADRIAELTLESNPTCELPTGLKPIAHSAISQVKGPQLSPNFSPSKVIDGYGGSIWIPPIKSDGTHRVPNFIPGQNTLSLQLDRPHQVRLVCVVNGLSNTFANYANWGRVRTLTVWGDDGVRQTAVLRSLGTESFPNAQIAAKGLGSTKTVSIRLDDTYSGQTEESYDPDVCFDAKADQAVPRPAGMRGQPRYAPGCIVNPTPMAGLADVFLYESDS